MSALPGSTTIGGVQRPTILLTGFEPFGGEAVNPSWQVAQAWNGRPVGPAVVHAVLLPCVFGQALQVLQGALRDTRPGLVLALGQAAGRCDFSIERVAINVDDARIPDNAGAQPVDLPVVPGAPAAYFSTLPIKAMVAALRAAGLPASVSQTAGTFVCNHVFYGLLHALAAAQPLGRDADEGAGRAGPARHGGRARGGFMHLPLLPQQASAHPGLPCLPLDTLVHGVGLALQTAWEVQDDMHVAGGATH